jgi:PLD-like domain
MQVLERLEAETRHSGGQTLDICMYALTDRKIATRLRELAQHGVVERIYRDGSEYKSEQRHAGRYGSAMQLLIGQPNVHIRVKPASRRDLMHLKALCANRALLRDCDRNNNLAAVGTINWPQGR